MSWDVSGYGSHAETSVEAGAQTWYIAEGATHSGFELFYLLMTPTATDAMVRITYLRPGGASPIVKFYPVTANSRFTVWVNRESPELASAEVSAEVLATNGVSIIVERAMYLSRPGVPFAAGHGSAAVTGPRKEWFLAEGATGPYFDLYILIANPAANAATVTATYLLPSGATLVRTYTVPAMSRQTIFVDAEDPMLADTAVSTTISATEGVIVERAMWWPGDLSTWAEAHNTPGAAATGTQWALAEGEVGGSRATETYILVANTSSFAARTNVTLFFEDGTTAEKTYTIAARSRFNVPVATEFPAAAGRRFAAVVEAVGSPAAQIVVERAMYSNAGGVQWAAGTNALGVRLK
jgi:hypothetical protein